MHPFTFNTAKSVVFRPGAAAELGAIAGPIVGGHTLLVTDPGISRLGLAEPAIASLRLSGTKVTMFDRVAADPPLATLLAATEVARSTGARSIVGFGGGSSLDVAKLAALLAGSGEDLDRAWGVGNAKGPRLPLILVPTTAGTGSEVTPVSIITLPDGEKRGVSSPLILPDLAVLDPDLTIGLPPSITAHTGVDAMVHAIEAYSSANANNNPVSRMLARDALRLLGAGIEEAVFNGRDRAARSAMLLGSMLAGQAFANSPVAAVHALAYPVGGMFHVPHGLSNALLLAHVMRFNLSAAHAAYAQIAADAFPHLGEIEAVEARADAFIEALAGLCVRLGMPVRLRDVGIPESALETMAREAMKQTRLLVNNPRPVTEADAFSIYRAAW